MLFHVERTGIEGESVAEKRETPVRHPSSPGYSAWVGEKLGNN
jgi:hypothetical protein